MNGAVLNQEGISQKASHILSRLKRDTISQTVLDNQFLRTYLIAFVV